MSTSKVLNILINIPYFSEIPASDLEIIAQKATEVNCETDEAIFIEGDPSLGVYIVESGWFKIIKLSPNGREQVINVIGPGEAFNAFSIFSDVSNQATAVALETSTTWLIRKEEMVKMLDTYPKLAQAVIKILSKRIQHLVTLVEDLSLRSVESRLARLLLENASDERVHRKQWATQTEMAARLGTVTEVLSRTLRKLTEDGLIRVSRHQIQILDPKELGIRAKYK